MLKAVCNFLTKADLKELLANLPYNSYEKKKEETPNQPVERMTIVCMGHEPDLKASLEQELSDYKVDVQILDVLRDKADLQLMKIYNRIFYLATTKPKAINAYKLVAFFRGKLFCEI